MESGVPIKTLHEKEDIYFNISHGIIYLFNVFLVIAYVKVRKETSCEKSIGKELTEN